MLYNDDDHSHGLQRFMMFHTIIYTIHPSLSLVDGWYTYVFKRLHRWISLEKIIGLFLAGDEPQLALLQLSKLNKIPQLTQDFRSQNWCWVMSPLRGSIIQRLQNFRANAPPHEAPSRGDDSGRSQGRSITKNIFDQHERLINPLDYEHLWATNIHKHPGPT